jgi:hypothetical protein
MRPPARPIRFGAVAILTMVVAAFASGCGSQTSPTVADTTPPDSLATVAARWTAPTTDALGIDLPSACPMPWAPVYVEQSRYSGPTVSSGTMPPPTGPPHEGLDAIHDPAIDLNARAHTGPDQATGQSGIVVLGTGDSQIAIGGANRIVGWPGGRTWIGDLDGDGHDEMAVISTGEGQYAGTQHVIVVPGTIGPGLHDPFSVGVVLPTDAQQGQWIMGVGDVDGDGADDVLMSNGDRLVVVSGRDLMAPGPGGHIDVAPTPIAVPPPDIAGWLSLAPATRPVVARIMNSTLELVTDPTVSLRIADTINGAPLDLIGNPIVSAYLSSGHRIVVLSTDAGRSGINQRQMWDLDAPCR